MKSIRNLVIIVMALSLLSFSGGKKLRFNFKTSDIYKLELNTEHEIMQEFKGRLHNSLTEVSSLLFFEIQEKTADDVYKMKVWYEKMNILIEAEYYIIEMYSERSLEDGDIMDEIVKNIINQPFNIEMSANGDILKITGLDKIYSNALKSFEFLDKKTKEELRKSLDIAIGKKAIEENLELISAFYPKNEVILGDTWVTTSSKESMSTKYENNYNLEEISDNIYTINMNANISNNSVNQGEIPVNYLVSGIQSGKLKINEQTGWIVEGNINQQLSGSVKINKCNEFPDGFECPVQYKTKIQYRSVD